MENELYARPPKNINNNKTTNLSNDHQKNVQFTTAEENLIFLSSKQIARAKAARIFSHIMEKRIKNSHNSKLNER